MRKSFYALSGLVSSMGLDVCTGDAYVFVARNRKRAKVLVHDGTGLCLLAKRLDIGRFPSLWRDDVTSYVDLSVSELSLLLEGCELVGRLSLRPPTLDMERASRVALADFK